ncbi:MAG: hypothetical protein DRH10_07285, partial [Deltaproteobacteria bacterium]
MVNGSASAAYDSGTKTLTINIQDGVTTAATVISEVNTGPNSGSIPFTASNAAGNDGTGAIFTALTTETGTGSDAPATATVTPPGANNNLVFTANTAGVEFSDVAIVFVDGAVEGQEVAVYDATFKTLTISIEAGVSTAQGVIAAVNREGTFTATAATGGDDDSSTINVSGIDITQTVVGQDEVQAKYNVAPLGDNNDFVVEAKRDPDGQGTLYNDVTIKLLDNGTITDGTASAQYDPATRTLSIIIQNGHTTATQVITAINDEGTFNASNASGNNGTGTINTASVTTSGGGTGTKAHATISPLGDNNDIYFEAVTEGSDYNDVTIGFFDDGSITDGSATAVYDNTAKTLAIYIQNGVTTAGAVITAVDDEGTFDASNASGDDGTGIIHAAPVTNTRVGVDEVKAKYSVTPSGGDNDLVIEAKHAADGAGSLYHGVSISFIDDGSITDGSASASYNSGDKTLTIKIQNNSTTAAAVVKAVIEEGTFNAGGTGIINTAPVETVGSLAQVKDINQAGNSNPANLLDINNVLYFTADDGTNGRELWTTDGTSANTTMVKDINPGAGGSDPTGLTNLNNVLYFTADDGTNGRELWMSDGTSANTTMVKDINPGAGGSDPTGLTNLNNVLYFTADDG